MVFLLYSREAASNLSLGSTYWPIEIGIESVGWASHTFHRKGEWLECHGKDYHHSSEATIWTQKTLRRSRV